MTRQHSSPRQLAKAAGLRYVSDEQPGISRQRRGRGFSYVYASGWRVRSPRHLQRIDTLAIPPAWTDVWICRDPRGHLQATGRDDKNRKQFLYHEKWQTVSNVAKFEQLTGLGHALPRIRRRVTADLRQPALTREKTLALAVRVLDLTGIRIGNDEYAAANGSHGLTTLQRRHLRFNGSSVEFRFPGKSGQRQMVQVNDPTALRALRAAADCDATLFSYETDDGTRSIDSQDVNDYLRGISAIDVTAKDFRTWLASAQAATRLFEQRGEADAGQRKKIVVTVTKEVADRLGNTPAVCRGSYLDPRVVTAFEEGKFARLFRGFRCRRRKWLRREDQIYRRLLKHQ